jgi:hypothetical protein
MTTLFGRKWSREELETHVGDFSQLAGITLIELADGPARGVRALIFRTGSGLEFWVLVDRAFDIAKCQFRGIELGWQSPVGVRAPWFHEVNDEAGASFHRSFSGFLVTAGLDHIHGAYRESADRYFAPDRHTIQQPLHGRLHATPGQLVGYGYEWRGERCILYCEGIVKQAAVFGEHLVLTRRYEAELGTTSFTIRDRVRNHSFYTTPHMLLYHFNLGFPLLNEGAEFVAPTRGPLWHARDPQSDGFDYRIQSGPRENFVEQAYVHEIIADSAGPIRAALVNSSLEQGLGVAIEFNKNQLPYLIQWQNFQAGSYGMAIEPSTAHALGRAHAESRRELSWLKHGDERTYDLRVSILSGPTEISAFESGV